MIGARTSLLILLFLSLGLTARAQLAHEAILVDEYSSPTGCDEFIGRLDVFLGELRNHPDSKGVIILRDDPSLRHRSRILQASIASWMEYREFDSQRVEFIRADANKHSREFWRVPPAASNPPVERVITGFQMSETVTKPFMLTEERPTHICPEIDSFKIFAGFLKHNRRARGNIVVRNNSRTVASRRAASIVRQLQSGYGIHKKRLRTFLTKSGRPSSDEAAVEYWYLP